MTRIKGESKVSDEEHVYFVGGPWAGTFTRMRIWEKRLDVVEFQGKRTQKWVKIKLVDLMTLDDLPEETHRIPMTLKKGRKNIVFTLVSGVYRLNKELARYEWVQLEEHGSVTQLKPEECLDPASPEDHHARRMPNFLLERCERPA